MLSSQVNNIEVRRFLKSSQTNKKHFTCPKFLLSLSLKASTEKGVFLRGSCFYAKDGISIVFIIECIDKYWTSLYLTFKVSTGKESHFKGFLVLEKVYIDFIREFIGKYLSCLHLTLKASTKKETPFKGFFLLYKAQSMDRRNTWDYR